MHDQDLTTALLPVVRYADKFCIKINYVEYNFSISLNVTDKIILLLLRENKFRRSIVKYKIYRAT